MIDTVKIIIPVSKELKEIIRINSVETKRTHNTLNSVEIYYFNCHVELPSYFRGINIFHDLYKEDKIYIELSLPKFIYGHNLYLITAKQALKACYNLHKLLQDRFGQFTPVEEWNINRIDLCYNWSLPTYEDAISLLGIIRSFTYPRKKTINYPTSLYSQSQLSTVKFYLKYDEFLQHDYRAIKKIDLLRSEQLLGMSRNILRFEAQLRIRTIRRDFALGNSDVPLVKILSSDKMILSILQKYFYKMFNNFNTNLSDNLTILKKLHNNYGKTEAIHLFEFYKLLQSPILEDRLILKHEYSEATIRRKKKKLKDIGIGLSTRNKNLLKIDFKIPSKHNSNNYLIPCDTDVRVYSNTRT